MDKNCKIVIAFLLGILAYYFLFKKDLVEGACIGGDNCGEITGHADCVEQSGCRLEGTTIEGDNTKICSTIPTASLSGIIRSIEGSGNGGLPNTGMGSGSTSIPSNPALRSQIGTLNRQQMNELGMRIFQALKGAASQVDTEVGEEEEDDEGFTNLVEGLSNQQIQSILDYLENSDSRIINNDYDPEMFNSLMSLHSLIGTERFNEELNTWLDADENQDIKEYLQQYYGDTEDIENYLLRLINELFLYNEENPESEEVGLRCLDDPEYMEDRHLTCEEAYGYLGNADPSHHSIGAPQLVDANVVDRLRNVDENMDLTTSMGKRPGSDPDNPEPIFPDLSEPNTQSYRICPANKRFITGHNLRSCSEQNCCEDIPLEERDDYTRNRVTYPSGTKIIFCHTHSEWRNIMDFLVRNYDRQSNSSGDPGQSVFNRIAFATTQPVTYSSTDTGITEESMKMKFAQSIEDIYISIKNHNHLKNLTLSEKEEVGFDVNNLPPFNINDITNVSICNGNEPTTAGENVQLENRNQCEEFNSFPQCSG